MSEEVEEVSKRRMPENLNKHMLKVQGGKMYLPAAYRILWFRDECQDWGVDTDLIEGGQDAGIATVKARIYNSEGKLIATGHKTETRTDFPAGWVEKAETGAIARALAIAGFGTQFSSGDLEEGRYADSPTIGARKSTATRVAEHMEANGQQYPQGNGPASVPIWEGEGLCPGCNAPNGKRHGARCPSLEAVNA